MNESMEDIMDRNSDIDDALESPKKYKVWISTDGKMSIEFIAGHSREIENTLNDLTGAWATLKRWSNETKASGIKAVNEAVKPIAKTSSWCTVHQVGMAAGVSKTTGKAYSYHDMPEGRCFGTGVKARQ